MARMSLVPVVALALIAACGNEPPSMPADPPVPPPHESDKQAAAATAAGHAGANHGAAAQGAFIAAPEGAKVMFLEPADGASVTSPVKVVFGVEGMEVKPAADETANSGHHHIIVDGEPVEAGTVVPKDETHIHFGTGATEAELELSPGEHTLTMQFADLAHRSYGPAMTSTIKVTVAEAPAGE